MEKPYELPPAINEMTDTFEIIPDHIHDWQYATMLPHQRKHVITNAPMTMLSVVLICSCGAQHHSWLIPPPEPEADQRRAAGMDDPRLIGSKPS